MQTLPRPSSVIEPSACNRQKSPGIDQRLPSIVGNVFAVFAASFQYPTGMLPPRAMKPGSPDPAAIGLCSGENTATSVPIVNFAVGTSPSFVVAAIAKPTASEDPNESSSVT